VPTYEFPALGFNPARGDPAAVETAAQASRQFAERLARDVATLNRMQAATWVGEAGDAFREKVKDLPRDLDRARAAHEATGTALRGYATALGEAQRRAIQLEQEAAEALRQQQAAVTQANSIAQQANAAQEPARSQLVANYNTVASRANSYGDRLAQLRADARRLQADISSQGDQAAGRVRGAADAPYEEPSWWKKAWDGFMNWVRDNADILKKISGILKIVSAICALLSFIPVVGVFFGAVALIAGGIALAIDIAVKLATGEGSWAGIALDAALTFIPGGKLTKLLGTPLKAAGRAFAKAAPKLADAITGGAKAASGAIQTGIYQLSRLGPKTRAFERMAGEINGLPTAAGRWTAGHAPSAPLATAAERRFTNLVSGGHTPEAAWDALSAAERRNIRSNQFNRFWGNVDNQLNTNPQFAERYGRYFSETDRLNMGSSPPRAAQHFDPVTRTERAYELSHEPVRISQGGGSQIPRQSWQHVVLDPGGRQLGHNPGQANYLNDWLRTGRLSPIPDDFFTSSDSDTRTPAGAR
jgi:hypothetical protein